MLDVLQLLQKTKYTQRKELLLSNAEILFLKMLYLKLKIIDISTLLRCNWVYYYAITIGRFEEKNSQ